MAILHDSRAHFGRAGFKAIGFSERCDFAFVLAEALVLAKFALFAGFSPSLAPLILGLRLGQCAGLLCCPSSVLAPSSASCLELGARPSRGSLPAE